MEPLYDVKAAVGSRGHAKFMNDPIHGHIRIPGYAVDVIDTPQFQRLRDVRQLGSCYYIFPGATHNRFEHCIGVAHLADKMVRQFSETQPELEITAREGRCVRLAGLCHDLGHGMLSHSFEEFMHRARPERNWHHEQASEMMLDDLLDDPENHVPAELLEKADREFVKALIRGTPLSTTHAQERGFLYQIVANKRNSIDVDKFDYIQRDCYNTGLRNSYDCSRLMTFSRVIGNEVCFHQKEVYNLLEMFHTRYSLFKNVYTHRTGKAIELMFVDALLAAEPTLRLSHVVDDPAAYVNVTDALLREIERSSDPSLAASKKILGRMRRRDLYKFVDQVNLPSTPQVRAFLEHDFSERRILQLARGVSTVAAASDLPQNPALAAGTLSPDDFSVSWSAVNYANGDQNPLDFVRVYSKYDDTRALPVDRTHVSYLVPEVYEELLVRVYAKDATKMNLIQDAFRSALAHLRIEGSPLSPFSVSTSLDAAAKRQPSPDPAASTPTKRIRHYGIGALAVPEPLALVDGAVPTAASTPSRHSSPGRSIPLTPNAALTLPENYVPQRGTPRR